MLYKPVGEGRVLHQPLLANRRIYHITALWVGTCESFFLRSNRIGCPIRFRIEFSNLIGRIYQRIFNPFHQYLFCVCHEREWCTQLSTCYSFQFSPKTRQTMPLYDYLTPKLYFKRKFNHRQSFIYKGRLTVWTIRKFWIGSSLRIESRIGSSIWHRISKLRRSLPLSGTKLYLVTVVARICTCDLQIASPLPYQYHCYATHIDLELGTFIPFYSQPIP